MLQVNDSIVIDGPGNGNPESPISLKARLEKREFKETDLDEAIERITNGEFLISVRAEAIETCGDGRSANNQDPARAQMFGGTPALAKDDQLAGTEVFGKTDDKLLSRMDTMIDWRKDCGYPTGNHQDDHAEGTKSGCGEQDGAPGAYTRIAADSEEVRGVVNSLLSTLELDEISVEAYGKIAARANDALSKELLPTGAEVRDLVVEKAGKDAIEELTDKHNELIYIINMIPGATFDRESFRQQYGKKGIDAFNEDQAIIDIELERMSDSEDTFKQLSIANLVRRIATAMNLTKNDLKIVILK